MLRVSSVSKSFGAELVLRDVSFTIAPGSRVGLIGANGSGKSTLLKIIQGEWWPDSGSVTIVPPGSIAYLPQSPDPSDAASTAREALLRATGRVGQLALEITQH